MALNGFVALLRELGLLRSVKGSAFRAEGETGQAVERERELIPESAFTPEDLSAMQSIFDEACQARDAHTAEHRAAIATVVVSTYQTGERSRQRLLDAAMAAAL
jgi:hypothetical protein